MVASLLVEVYEQSADGRTRRTSAAETRPSRSERPNPAPQGSAALRFGVVDHHRPTVPRDAYQEHGPQRATGRIIPGTGGLRHRQRLQPGPAIQGGSDRRPEPFDRRGLEGTETRGHRAGQEGGTADRRTIGTSTAGVAPPRTVRLARGVVAGGQRFCRPPGGRANRWRTRTSAGEQEAKEKRQEEERNSPEVRHALAGTQSVDHL